VPLQNTLQLVRSQRCCRGRSYADPGSIDSGRGNRDAKSLALAKNTESALYRV